MTMDSSNPASSSSSSINKPLLSYSGANLDTSSASPLPSIYSNPQYQQHYSHIANHYSQAAEPYQQSQYNIDSHSVHFNDPKASSTYPPHQEQYVQSQHQPTITPKARFGKRSMHLAGNGRIARIDGIDNANGSLVNASRVEKPARKRKERPQKKINSSVQRVDTPNSTSSLSTAAEDVRKPDDHIQPLSVLAYESPHIEVADIAKFVQRSASERVEEQKRSREPDRTKRPMNAFMLYRKAYQNIAMLLCSQNNHQFVSQVCGTAWSKESAAVQEQFKIWAKIEGANHRAAHPNYKFTPAKAKNNEEESVQRTRPQSSSTSQHSNLVVEDYNRSQLIAPQSNYAVSYGYLANNERIRSPVGNCYYPVNTTSEHLSQVHSNNAIPSTEAHGLGIQTMDGSQFYHNESNIIDGRCYDNMNSARYTSNYYPSLHHQGAPYVTPTNLSDDHFHSMFSTSTPCLSNSSSSSGSPFVSNPSHNSISPTSDPSPCSSYPNQSHFQNMVAYPTPQQEFGMSSLLIPYAEPSSHVDPTLYADARPSYYPLRDSHALSNRQYISLAPPIGISGDMETLDVLDEVLTQDPQLKYLRGDTDDWNIRQVGGSV